VLKGWLTSEQGGQRWGWNLVKFLVILIAFYFGASIAANLTRHAAMRIQGVSQLLVAFLGKFVRQAIIVIGLVVALAALEVNIAPLLAAVGAAGFVVAFALQDTLSNFASGMLILAYRPFDVGHVVDAAGVSGIVDSVSLFSTHIRTFDNKMMIVPNNDIWGGTITNASASATRRVDMVFGIGYSDDVEQARRILESLVAEHALVLPDPAPVIQLNELADSSVNFICRPWVKTGDYWTVYWDITRGVKEAFDREGISIPFPQHDVHIHQADKPTGA
jgi:small conductance mechanosensitive channel